MDEIRAPEVHECSDYFLAPYVLLDTQKQRGKLDWLGFAVSDWVQSLPLLTEVNFWMNLYLRVTKKLKQRWVQLLVPFVQTLDGSSSLMPPSDAAAGALVFPGGYWCWRSRQKMSSDFACCWCVWRKLAQPVSLAELPFAVCSTAEKSTECPLQTCPP